MSQQLINIGTVANDGTGDAIRTSFTKVNQNFTELYGNVAVITANTVLTTQTIVIANVSLPSSNIGITLPNCATMANAFITVRTHDPSNSGKFVIVNTSVGHGTIYSNTNTSTSTITATDIGLKFFSIGSNWLVIS